MGYTYNMDDMSRDDMPLYVPPGAYVLYQFDGRASPELAVRVPGDEDGRPGYVKLAAVPAAKERTVREEAHPLSVIFWTPTAGWYNISVEGAPVYVERALRRSGARALVPGDLRTSAFHVGTGRMPTESNLQRAAPGVMYDLWKPKYPENCAEAVRLLRGGRRLGAALTPLVALTSTEDSPFEGAVRVGIAYAGAWSLSEDDRLSVSPAKTYTKVVNKTLAQLGLM